MNDTLSGKVTLILPVRSIDRQVDRCLQSLLAGTVVPEIIVMDCTASPDAPKQINNKFPQVRVFSFGMNPGRAHAVNTGIHLARTPYVMTFSPDLIAGKHCVERLCLALDEDSSLLSAQARIMSAYDPAWIRGAGWRLSPGAQPVKRGDGAKFPAYSKRAKITAAQMEAAVYRMEYLEVTGILDERYYGRLEDLDLGCRGILCGFYNLYEPQAFCREQASRAADMGKERFYRQLETGNMIYFRYKFGVGGVSEKLRGMLDKIVTTADNSALDTFRGALGMQGTDPGSNANAEKSKYDAAVERGRMLCFQAEMELMEREELGMSVTKQTLPEEACLQARSDGPENVYPLYLGDRIDRPFRDLARLFLSFE